MLRVLSLLILIPNLLIGQITIGGQVNQYAKVLSIVPCSASISVDDASSFAVGQKIMIIQMQGASIEEGNNPSFGDITNLNGAGQYEIGRIQSISGNFISFEFSLLNDYLIEGNIQIVSIPEYTSVTVGSTLTPQDWNGATGGVLALSVSDTLMLAADINANGSGFRGGELMMPESNCFWFLDEDNYFYEEGNWRGALKGEGIAEYILDKEAGRGSQANGGGGGNDHNSGGGGGSNFTGGGQGGFQTSPSNFGCSGDFPGEGGIAIPTNEGVFLGGGGGAGHSDDNNAGSAGGNGGGIIVLEVGTLIANGHIIESAGDTAQLAFGDGAGGGGAGGTILFLADDYSPDLALSVQGGTGASTLNILDRCFGPGGGGSGGRILSSLPGLPNLDLSPGLNGQNANVNSNCPDLANGAQTGDNGLTGTITELPTSQVPIEMVEILPLPDFWEVCVDQLATLFVSASGGDLNFQWQVNEGLGYMNLSDDAIYQGTSTSTLELVAPELIQAGNVYRCVVTSDCFGVFFTTDTELIVEEAPMGSFDFTQIEDEVTFEAMSSNATIFEWNFGDDSTAVGSNPIHIYNSIGIYVVELTITNDCGTLTLTDTVQVGLAPEANFNFDFPGGCAPLTVMFTDLSANDPDAWNWSFPGGVPESSTEQNPTVVYTDPGLYDVTLEASNAVGSSSFLIEDAIEVFEPPIADFIYQINGDTVAFANTSTGDITSYQWVFGNDPTGSGDENPTYIFTEPGIYEVTLSVSNPYCGSFVTYIIEIISTGITEINSCISKIWPVPAVSSLTVNACKAVQSFRLFDLQGRLLLTDDFGGQQIDKGSEINIELNGLLPGTYMLELISDEGVEYLKVVVI